MTSTAPPSKKRARRTLDALSLFLVAAMGTLLVMYFIDSGKQDTITSHQARAQSLRHDLATLPSDCVLEAAGAGGATLLIRCADTPSATLTPLLSEALTRAPLPAWVEAIALRDATHTLLCDTALSSCQPPRPLPSREELSASRRRPPR